METPIKLYLKASEVVAIYGFTPRYWKRKATEGLVKGISSPYWSFERASVDAFMSGGKGVIGASEAERLAEIDQAKKQEELLTARTGLLKAEKAHRTAQGDLDAIVEREKAVTEKEAEVKSVSDKVAMVRAVASTVMNTRNDIIRCIDGLRDTLGNPALVTFGSWLSRLKATETTRELVTVYSLLTNYDDLLEKTKAKLSDLEIEIK